MTTENSESGQRADQMLGDMVKDADEYFRRLKGRHLSETRLDGALVSLVVWFASFVVLGVWAFTAVRAGVALDYYLLGAFLGAIAIGVSAGAITYAVRRRRGFKFVELGALLTKIKERGASAEDGLRLMDAMHQTAAAVRKRRLDSAFEYGIIAFAVVSLFGLNAGIGAVAGLVVYLYFRSEAFREYEKEENRYEASKNELLQSL